jgi:hypothetical protein
MRLHERPNEPTPCPTPEGAATGGPGGLEELASQGASLVAAGHDIINAALSGNSEAFLAANRQMGGQ